MKRIFLILLFFLLFKGYLQSQIVQITNETFESTLTGWTITPSTSWKADTSRYAGGHTSYLGQVPISNNPGDTSILISPMYNLSSYGYVWLSFDQICKVSASDICQIEYRQNYMGAVWQTIPVSAYSGSGVYTGAKFSHASYADWQPGDSLAVPTNAWWKSEQFDISDEVSFSQVQFRFKITRGSAIGSYFVYGWLIDNFKIMASVNPIAPPVVEFTSTYSDTVYNTGPFVITAKVATRTSARILTPKLNYSATYNSITIYDSIVMTATSGDTMWTATIPQHVFGTSMVYSITGKDSVGNTNYAQKGMYLKRAGGVNKTVTINNGNNSQVVIPMNSAHPYSYTQQIYTAAEMTGTGMITSIAFDVSVSNASSQSIDVYVAHTSQSTIASTSNYIPGANLSLVYSGTYTFSTTGWNTISLQTPFLYNGTDNIVVAFDKNTGAAATGLAFNNETTVNSMAIRFYGSTDISPITLGGTASITSNYRPNIRFNLQGSSDDSNAVALLSIDNPLKGATGGLQAVKVSIKNKGIKYLDSCIINWKVNGILQTPIVWRGHLPEDFNDTITIGYYTQRYNAFDSIVVWTSLPNGVLDSTSNDDTLKVNPYGCYGSISGEYIVGVGAGADVPSITTAFFIGSMCGVNGNVTLKLQNGVYNENWDFTGLADIMGNYTLTIKSLSGNKDSVILRPTAGAGITLNNTNNLIIKDITINNAISTGYGIQFTGAANNIEIRNNKFIGDLTGTSAATSPAPIYKPTSTGIANNIRIIGNSIEGGYYGIYFYAGIGTAVGEYGTQIQIDSNTIFNQYYYATYFYYTDFTSLSHNTFLSRINNAYTYWYGIRLYDCNFIANGNKIQARTSFTYFYGTYIYYAGYYNATGTSLFSNNEIIGITSGTYYGMYVGTYNNMDIVNNTIHMSGTGASRNIHVVSSTASNLTIKNNILINTSAGYPIYFAATTTPYTSDYNCLYGASNIGYYSSAQTTLTGWKTATSQDANSVSMNPTFVNTSNYLKPTSFTGLDCYQYPNVNQDIEGSYRIILTSMGCYTSVLPTQNGSLLSIENLKTSASVGDSSLLEVVLFNAGLTTISNATINWSINNVQQASINWSGSLLSIEKDTISLGKIMYQSGYNDVVVWISGLGMLNDTIHKDDTIRATNFTCDSVYNGVYSVGVGGKFTSLEQALDILNKCGILGTVTLELQSGTYSAIMIRDSVLGSSSVRKIIITSAARNADSVKFVGGSALTLNNASNYVFRDITFDARTAAYGILINGKTRNIEISHCKILANPTTSSSSDGGIYKASGEVADSVRIIGNLIDGGYYGIYFYAGNSTSVYGTGIIIDSNIISNQYYYATYFYYTDFTSLSHNTFLSRINNAYTYWYGIRLYDCNFIANGNKIQARTSFTYFYGTYIYYAGYYNATGTSLFSNNEIIGITSGTYYGMYVGTYNNLKIYNNSIYMSGTGASRNIYIVNSTSSILDIKNNILVNASGGHPIYAAGTTTPMTADYNCYYGSSYIGYYSSDHTNISSWKNTTGLDTHSIAYNPTFINVNNNLALSDYSSVIAPRLSNVLNDINGENRTKLTMMGAYSSPLFEGYNLAINEIIAPVEVNDIQCIADYSEVKVSINNKGTEEYNFAIDTLKIHIDVRGPINYQRDTIITTGNLGAVMIDTFTIETMLPLGKAGLYVFTISINTNRDTVYSDDTLKVNYRVKKIALPLDVDFTTLPSEMIIKQIAGSVSWGVETGTGINPSIAPVYGTGRLTFASSTGSGSISQAIFNGLDLRGTKDPKMEFWYAHDATSTNNDFLTVYASTDGGATKQNLYMVQRYNAGYTTPGWARYEVDLSAYDQAACLSLIIEANSFGGANQNIDRIRITSVQDIAVSIIVPNQMDLVACDLQNKELKVIVENKTSQVIDFEKDTTQIEVKVNGVVSQSYRFPLNGQLEGLAKDTILVSNTYDLSLGGMYYFSAYVNAIDTIQNNDTAKKTLTINPDITLRSINGVDAVHCKKVGDTVYVGMRIVNTGNLFITQIPLQLQINGTIQVNENVTFYLQAGDSADYTFSQAYYVPVVSDVQPYYKVKVAAKLDCDPDTTNNVKEITACVEIPEVIDLGIQSINKPVATVCDSGYKTVYVSVTLENGGNQDIENAVIHVEVDSAGTTKASFSETSNAILKENTLTYIFTQGYTVPNFSGNYTVKVYVDSLSKDIEITNDTMIVNACAIYNDVSINKYTEQHWSMGQNIPNPARNTIEIPYTIPQSGEVRFKVMTITGQILYERVIETKEGTHVIDWNTEQLSSGIYYYSMEYQGQSMVKKMTIQK